MIKGQGQCSCVLSVLPFSFVWVFWSLVGCLVTGEVSEVQHSRFQGVAVTTVVVAVVVAAVVVVAVVVAVALQMGTT